MEEKQGIINIVTTMHVIRGNLEELACDWLPQPIKNSSKDEEFSEKRKHNSSGTKMKGGSSPECGEDMARDWPPHSMEVFS